MTYKIVTADTIEELEAAVSARLAAGYKLHGNPMLVMGGKGKDAKPQWLQPMVHPNKGAT